MYACSPKWKGDWFSENDLKNCLSQLSETIQPSPRGKRTISLNHGLHFTGGEPFLNFDLLLNAVRLAADLGIPSTFVETNCYWCTTDDVTRKHLTHLRDTGLTGILISVNPFYSEWIPFERTERCIKISEEIFGQNLIVYQLEFYRLFKSLGVKSKLSFDNYLNLTANMNFTANVELFLMGRATRRLRKYYPAYPAVRFYGEPCRPQFLRNWHNHFDNYGNFIAGYCGGISLGHWRNLQDLIKEGIDLKAHPILACLIAGDIQQLLNLAEDFGYQESRQGYLSKCDLCQDIRKFLVSKQDFDELRPKEYYTHLEGN
jgi:hypothetical protein